MKMAKCVLALLLLSGGALAGDITTSNGVELLVVNGKEVDNFPGGSKREVSLSEGQYQVVIRFEEDVKRGSKSALYTSKPYVLDLAVPVGDLELSVPRMASHSQVSAYFNDPEWLVTDVNSGKVAAVRGEELPGSGFAAFRDIEKAVANYNRENGIAVVNGQTHDLQTAAVAVDDKGNVEIKGDSLTQLKLWYTKASNEEKKAFKRWMIDQDF